MSFLLARRATAAPQFARAFSSTSARPTARITIVGTLGNTPEIQSTSSGREVLKYSIASNVKVRGESRVSWFKVSNFAIDGARREFFLSLPKGTLVQVEGDVNVMQFKDPETEKFRSSFNITQRSLDVLRRARPQEERSEEEGSEE